VSGLGKQYVLGGAESGNESFREMLTGALSAPFRRLKRLQGEGADGDSFWALKEVNFQIKPGEVVGIIGRNGAGKSTLLKILSRITDPTEGRIEMRGRVSSLLEVGTGFHPELTGRENIFLNGAILGMSRREILDKFDAIVEFAEVEKFLDTPVKRYSSGMYVRLAFAVAAHLEPEILVVDEVLAVGDAAFQKKCLGKMQDVGREGRTVLFVSHNMGMIRSLCSRCILLSSGSVELDGDVGEVVEAYFSSGIETEEGEVQWEGDQAPGGKEICLRGIRLLDAHGNAQSIFDAAAVMDVEIAYEVFEPLRGMRLSLQFVTQDGVVAFTTTDHHQTGETTLLPGRYVAKCRIPENLLNQGGYMIRVHAGIPGVRVLIEGREYLRAQVVGSGAGGSFYKEKWAGVVAPKLVWSMKKKGGVHCEGF